MGPAQGKVEGGPSPPGRSTAAGQEAAAASGGGGAGAGGGAEAKPTLAEALYAGLGRVVEIFRRFDLTLTDEVDKVDFRRTLVAVLVGDFDRKEIDQLFERFEVDALTLTLTPTLTLTLTPTLTSTLALTLTLTLTRWTAAARSTTRTSIGSSARSITS